MSRFRQAPPQQRFWVLYDKRAKSGDTSRAAVIDTAESRSEAKREAKFYMRQREGVAVYSCRLDGDNKMVDERGPYKFGGLW